MQNKCKLVLNLTRREYGVQKCNIYDMQQGDSIQVWMPPSILYKDPHKRYRLPILSSIATHAIHADSKLASSQSTHIWPIYNCACISQKRPARRCIKPPVLLSVWHSTKTMLSTVPSTGSQLIALHRLTAIVPLYTQQRPLNISYIIYTVLLYSSCSCWSL